MEPREKEDEIKKSLRKMEHYTPGIAFFFRTDPGKIYKEIDNIIARYSPTENMADFPWEEIDVPDIDFLYTQLDNGAIPRRFNFYANTEYEADASASDPKAEEIDHPSRYCKGGMECHDAIAAAVSNLVGVQAFDTGQVIRYMWRWADKGGTLDLQKARNYIDYLIKDVEANGIKGGEVK